MKKDNSADLVQDAHCAASRRPEICGRPIYKTKRRVRLVRGTNDLGGVLR
jgi:hypothetical protein